MSVFEELISELKQEALLEETATPDKNDGAHTEVSEQQRRASAHRRRSAVAVEPETVQKPPRSEKPRNGSEFYKRRAIGELSGLQMVDHVLSGVERQYLKIVPRTYDDLEAKKALHNFLQITDDENSTTRAEAEFSLMNETAAWCSALASRDNDISVSFLRNYVETSKPPLSSQALISLARFYRNLPFSETVRAKFDFMITRLFTRTVADGTRVCLFSKDEVVRHLDGLYSEWSSVVLYTADADDPHILLAALSFDDLALEAENVSSVDRLISSSFFNRLRTFKESIGESFFAPVITAASIDTNVRVGNAFTQLLREERQREDFESIWSTYEDFDSDSLSDVLGSTVNVGKLLHRSGANTRMAKAPAIIQNIAPAAIDTGEIPANGQEDGVDPDQNPSEKKALRPALKLKSRPLNPWIAAVATALVVSTIVIYLYSNYLSDTRGMDAGVIVMNLENTVHKEHLSRGKISGETFYGVLRPSWHGLSKENRLEFLKMVYDAGPQHGYTQVNLVAEDGRMAAYASRTRMEVNVP